jgi:hypothetical protein
MSEDRGCTCADARGHELDAVCVCSRCRRARHAFEVVETHEREIGRELVNPNADPGAMYLDSNFQPDYDYGRTRAMYERVTRYRCRRCQAETETRLEYAVEDE